MIKKVFYYSLMPSDSTSYYRTSAVMAFIKSDEFDLIDISHITNFNWSTLINCQAFIFQRPFSQDHANLITLAKDMGVKVILDYDDDLWNVDMCNPTYSMYLDNRINLNKCVSLADEVWVSTPSIKESVTKDKSKVYIIPNAHNDYLQPIYEKKHFNLNTKKVLWRGGGSHKADVREIDVDLVKIINENKGWTFTFMGDKFDYIIENTGDNCIFTPSMTVVQYFKQVSFDNPNIFIFPLRNNKFNHGKSNISWLEATYSGAGFIGKKELPEFNFDFIFNVDKVGTMFSEYTNQKMLKEYNEASWDYICNNLLLSDVNKIRVERIQANL